MNRRTPSFRTRDASPGASALAERIAELQEQALDDALGPRAQPRSSVASWVCRCGARSGFARKGTRPRLLHTATGAVSIKLYMVRCSACGAVFSPFRQLCELGSRGDRPEEILTRLQSRPPLGPYSGQALRSDSGQASHPAPRTSHPPPRADLSARTAQAGGTAALASLRATCLRAPHRQAPRQARRLRPFGLIDRHLLREMTVSFALGLGTFTFVLLMDQMMRLMELIINKGVGVGVVLRLILFILPYSLTVTIPMSVLLAVLATYGRASAEGEAIALKVSGLSLYRLMAPGVLVGIVATVATLWISIALQPTSTRAFKTLIHQLYQTRALTALEAGVFNTEYPGLTIYVDRLKEGNRSLQGILIIDRRSPTDQHVVIAKEGQMLNTTHGEGQAPIGIQLSKGYIYSSSSEDPGRHRSLTFDTYDLQIPAGGSLAEAMERPKQGREMNLGELRAQIERLKKDGGKAMPLQVELHKKFALPIACLILSVIGAPLAMRIKKASRGISLALSVAFAVFYYILLATGESLGGRGRIEPALGVWIPNLALGIIAIGLVLAEGREAILPVRLRTVIRATFSYQRSAFSNERSC